MAKSTNQDFIRGAGSNQSRTLATAGAAAMLAIVVAIVTTMVVYPRISGPSGTDVHLVLPNLGPGAQAGTKVLLRGAEVGVVKEADSTDPYSTELDIVLDDGVAHSLTDSFDVDFRPANYFGITGVNLKVKPGGEPIRDGQTIQRDAAPDYTMSTMIKESSIVVDGSLSRDMIRSLNKVTRYASGLSPLIETMIVVADNVSRTQKHLPSTLLNRLNNIMEVFPGANIEALGALDAVTNSSFNRMPDGSRGVDKQYHELMDKSLTVAADKLFGAAGVLLDSHSTELTPFINSVKNLVDPIPGVMGDASNMGKIQKAVEGLERSFKGPKGQQTLQLRVILDAIPGVAQPLKSMGVSTQVPSNKEGE